MFMTPDEEAMLAIFLARYNLGDMQGAVDILTDFITNHPDSWFAYRCLGQIRQELGRDTEAIESYDRALELKPDLHEAWYNRGYSLANLGRDEEAIKSYDRALHFKPDDHEAWNNRGYSLANLGRDEEAIKSYDRALHFKPDDHEAWNNRGYSLSSLGRYTEAIECYDRALHFKPDKHEAWNNRGISLDKLGRDEEAIKSYDRALHFKPDKHEAWYNRGISLDKLGRDEEAIASYDRALDFKPDLHQAWYNRGNSLAKLGRDEEAIKSYDRSLHFKRDDHEAWYNRGISLDKLGRYAEAIKCYDRALHFKPDYHEAWNNRGISLDKLGRFEEEIASYDRALDFKPDLHQAWNNRGNSLANLGRDAEAIESFDRALDFKPDYHEAWYNRGYSLAKLGRDEEAIESFEKGHFFDGNTIFLYIVFSAMIDEIPDGDKKNELTLKLAGKLKNIGLQWFYQAMGIDEEQIKDFKLQTQILTDDTAIVHWHVTEKLIIPTIFAPDGIKYLPMQAKSQGVKAMSMLAEGRSVSQASESANDEDEYEFEKWIENWKSNYHDYGTKGLKDTAAKQNHPWRKNMENQLRLLKNILDISGIETELTKNPKITKIIIVPHRDLHLLPIEYLFSEQFEITRLPDVNLPLFSRTPDVQPTTALNVVYSQGKNWLKYPSIQTKAIHKLFPQVLSVEEDKATKAEVKAALQNPADIFNFSGHAYHDTKNPKASALNLADGNFTVLEILESEIAKYYITILDGCETGMTGNVGLIEEFVGLGSCFLAKGSKYVVSGLWRIDERAGAILLLKFYQLIKNDSVPPILALKQAKTWLKNAKNSELGEWFTALAIELKDICQDQLELWHHIKQEGKRLGKTDTCNPDDQPYQHPYYWASFCIMGI